MDRNLKTRIIIQLEPLQKDLSSNLTGRTSLKVDKSRPQKDKSGMAGSFRDDVKLDTLTALQLAIGLLEVGSTSSAAIQLNAFSE